MQTCTDVASDKTKAAQRY